MPTVWGGYRCKRDGRSIWSHYPPPNQYLLAYGNQAGKQQNEG